MARMDCDVSPWIRRSAIQVPYPSVDIILLRFFVELAICAFPVDHAAVHRDGGAKDMVDEFWLASMAHGVEAAL